MTPDRSPTKRQAKSRQDSSQAKGLAEPHTKAPTLAKADTVEAVAVEAADGETSSVVEIIPVVEMIRATKDELNLVEHPFAVMWNKENGAVIHHEWEARHPITGKTLAASWRVTGDPEMGLPIPSDERVYLVLMELTREAGFANQNVYFTRHDLLKRLGWPHNPRHYQMLYDAFDRLKSVTILAKNAFWDPGHKSFRNVGFSMLDNFDILNERPGRKKKNGQTEMPISYFKWNDVIFQSFQNGYIRSLDLEFALSLKGDIALRLYRYLDKKSFDGRPNFEIELQALCVRHLAMKEARYASTYKARLKDAHDELRQRGFLQGVEYSPMKTKKAEKVRYIFHAAALPSPALTPASVPALEEAPPIAKPQLALSQSPDDSECPNSSPFLSSPVLALADDRGTKEQDPDDKQEPALEDTHTASLLARMTVVGVSPAVAGELLRTADHNHLALQLDCLGDRDAKNPAAVFIKAVRELWSLPPAYVARTEAGERAQQAREAAKTEEVDKARQRVAERQQRALADEETARLDAMWDNLDPKTRDRLDEEAKKRMGPMVQAGLLRGGAIPSGALAAMRRNVMRELLQIGGSGGSTGASQKEKGA